MVGWIKGHVVLLDLFEGIANLLQRLNDLFISDTRLAFGLDVSDDFLHNFYGTESVPLFQFDFV